MGNSATRWQGYEEQLMADKNVQSHFVPNSEEEGCSPIIRNPVAKENYLGYLKRKDLEEGDNKESKDDLTEEFDTGYKLYQYSVEKNKNSDFLGYRPFVDEKNKRGDYQWMTYGDFHVYVMAFGNGLQALGIEEKTCVGLYASNRPEWIAIHIANMTQSYKTTALYDTLGADAVAFILQHSEIPVVVCEKDKLKELFAAVKKCKATEKEETTQESKETDENKEILRLGLKYIVQIDYDPRYNNKHEQVQDEDKKQAEELNITLLGLTELFAKGKDKTDVKAPSRDDIAYIMYTSGTTGNPKGVMLPHRAFAAMCATAYRQVHCTHDDVHLSYLPMAHIFESFAQQVFLSAGAKIAFYQGDIRALGNDWKDIRPTILIGVPRVFDKTYSKFKMKTQSFGKMKKWLVEKAEESSRSGIRKGQRSKFYDKTVWSNVAPEIGFDKVRLVLSAGSALPPHLHEFMKIILPKAEILQGYGMTENCAGCMITNLGDPIPNHCGIPLDNTEVRLIDAAECQYTVKDQPCPRGEIVMRGLTMMTGYLKNPEKTKETIDEKGWLHTGDIGRINPNGTISIIDRRKNMFKTAHGEYIAAEKIEGIYSRAPTIGQIFVYGNQYKSFVIAIVVPNAQAFEDIFKKSGEWTKEVRAGTDEFNDYFAEVAEKHLDTIKQIIVKDMKNEEKDLKPFEQVKDIAIEYHIDKLMQGFSVENDCLTPTAKLKRPQITRKFIEQIKELYAKNGEEPKSEEHWG